ncbi:unnamed protein product [Closterium sp. NIES-53]
MSGASTAPAADADSTVRSQWLTRDAAARLAVRNHLPSTERAHFSQYKSARALYDALSVLLAATVAPPSLRGVPLSPFSPLLPLLLLSTSLALRRSALRLPLVGDAALARAREAGVVEGAMEAAVREVEEVEVVVRVVPGVGASVAAVEAVAAVAEGVAAAAAVVEVAEEVVLVAVQPRSVEALVATSVSSSCAPVRPRLFSSFVSGTLGVGGLGFPDAVELPRWHDLLLQNVPIFDLEFDAILAAMYALADITEGDCYLRVPPDPGTVAAALGASADAALGASASAAPGAVTSPLSGTAPTESFHTFTLDSGALRSFFRDSTTLTPLSRPVAVYLADASGAPVLAHSSTVLRVLRPRRACCQDSTSPRSLRTCQMFAAASRSSPASAPCSCRPLAHETLLWHHRLGHPSLPRLRGMASRPLVSGLPRSLPPLPPGPAPTCVPCVEGRQRATPHSSSFPPTEAPLQTLQMDMWGPAHVRGLGHERYFLLVVDDYSRYTTVFPLRSKGEVPEVLNDWIRGARRQLSESFGSDLPVLRLHSDRGGELASDKLRAFCRSEGIRQTFTLLASSQQNGIAERCIGMVMDVARTSMIHAAAPHFLWPFAVQYAAHQINLQPRVSLPETTPTLRWTGKVGDASAFRVWGSRAFVRDTTTDKLSSCAVPCVFLGFPPDAPGWQFYHPTSRRVLSSQDITFDESVSYYRLFPHRTTSPPPSPLFLAPDPAEPVEVVIDSGAARGANPAGAGSGGAETGGAGSEGTEIGRAKPGGVAPEGTVSGAAEPTPAESGGALGVLSRREPLSPQRLREWYSRRCRGAAGGGAAGGAGGATGATEGAAGAGAAGAAGGAAGAGGAGGATGATGGAGAAGGGAHAGAAGGAAGARAAGAPGGAGAAGGGAGAGATGGAAGTGDPGAEGTGSVSAVSGGAARPRPYYVPLLQQVLGSPPPPGPSPPFLSPPPVQSQSHLQPASPLPGPSPYSGPTRGLTERREPESCPMSPASLSASPVSTVRAGRVSRPRLPPIPGTHSMTLRPSIASQRVPLPSPPASSLPDGPDPESDSLRAASPTVTRFLATAVTDPLFESSAASALVAQLVDFAAAYRLDYATSLVAESASASVCPPSVGGECALGTDVLEDRQEDLECLAAASPHLVSMLLAPEGDPDALDIPTLHSYAEVIEGPYSSQWQAAMDAEMASWKSTGTYVDEVTPPGANIDSGMWIFSVKRPPGSPPAFKVRYVARGFSQRQGVDFFQTFSPTPKMTTLRALLHVAAQRDYELHSLDFSTAFLQGSLHEEIWLRRPPGFTGSFPAGTLWSLRRPVYGLRQAPCECTSGMGFVLGGQARVVLTSHADTSWVDDLATQRSSQGYTFSLGSGSVSWWSIRSSSVLSSSCEAEIYTGAMAAQELRWLIYLLTDLGEAPRSPPVLYVDNKAMLALCQEHRLEHRTKHIALRYFLARELQQRGQLRLAYVASQANTADVFTKALQPCDHQRFCTVLGLVPTVPHLLTS